MISWIHKRLQDNEEGFTLIELLVVVIIIGILAAIAIPTFLSQRERAWDGAAQSDLRNAAVAMESYATGNDGSYTGATLALIEDEGFNQSADVDTFTITVASDGNSYTIDASHAQSDTTFRYDSTTGSITEVTTTTTA